MDSTGPVLDRTDPPSLMELANEQEYARAALAYRQAKAEYERCRRELMIVVNRIGEDRDHLLSQKIAPQAKSLGASTIAYRVPLPATLPQIRAHMGWSTSRANDWLKYHIKKGHIMKRGRPRSFIYYYTEAYLEANAHLFTSIERPDVRGNGSSSSESKLAVSDS